MPDEPRIRPLATAPPGWYPCGTGIIYLPGVPRDEVEQIVRELEQRGD